VIETRGFEAEGGGDVMDRCRMLARRKATASLSQADGPTYMFLWVRGDKREGMP
jgi:hypothetical protein